MTKRVTVELTGRVKWFNHGKGFGFLVCDGCDSDVLVHHSVLREHGLRSVPEGAVLDVTAYLGDRGWQADRVTSIDMTNASEPAAASSSPKSTRQPHGAVGNWERVEVKWYNRVKGFGFLMRGDDDVFLHAAKLDAAGIDKLAIETGDIIEARIAHAQRGLIAIEVRQQPAQAIAA